VLQETQDREEIIARVAALDIGKAELACCVRVPAEGRRGRRLQEVQTYSTMTRSLLGMSETMPNRPLDHEPPGEPSRNEQISPFWAGVAVRQDQNVLRVTAGVSRIAW
jgi:hypothetical protein